MSFGLNRFYRFKAGRLLLSTIFARCFWMLEGEMAQPVVVNATGKHTATVIFLHGLGDTGHGWSQAFDNIKCPHIKYICPTANVIPVTLNGGFRMPSWFDIYSLSFNGKQDVEGIKTASELLKGWIAEEEKNGIPPNRIVIGGFSQGGALSLYTALTCTKNLAGVLVLSSWLSLHEDFVKNEVANKDTPILQCHGDCDPVVNIQFGEMTSSLLQAKCTKHEFKKYGGMGHSSCDQEIRDVREWLNKVLPA